MITNGSKLIVLSELKFVTFERRTITEYLKYLTEVNIMPKKEQNYFSIFLLTNSK